MNKFPLSEPVTVEGVTYSELGWRAPKGRDLRRLISTKDLGEAQHQLLVNLCEVPAEVLDEIPAGDYAALMERISPLLEPTKKTS